MLTSDINTSCWLPSRPSDPPLNVTLMDFHRVRSLKAGLRFLVLPQTAFQYPFCRFPWRWVGVTADIFLQFLKWERRKSFMIVNFRFEIKDTQRWISKSNKFFKQATFIFISLLLILLLSLELFLHDLFPLVIAFRIFAASQLPIFSIRAFWPITSLALFFTTMAPRATSSGSRSRTGATFVPPLVITFTIAWFGCRRWVTTTPTFLLDFFVLRSFYSFLRCNRLTTIFENLTNCFVLINYFLRKKQKMPDLEMLSICLRT